ncbi:MAG: trypsin-like serine protease, partial [Bdellovibrionales bacterium]
MTQLVQILITLSTLSPFASAVHRAVEIHDFERPEVVRLYSLMPGIFKDIQSFKDEYNNWCTGVAISDSEVLTAGHCLFPDLSEVRLEPYYVQVSS